MEAGENIRVAVRCRPLSGEEQSNGHHSVVDVFPDNAAISLLHPSQDKTTDGRDFTFDAVFGVESTQQEVYGTCVHSIVESVLQGYNATILAYGQTGTGKTYTMQGSKGEAAGIMLRVFKHVFERVHANSDVEYLIRVSYLELYNEEIRDLLDKNSQTKLQLKESKDRGVYVKNLRTVAVETQEDMNKVLKIGSKNRSVGETLMNKDSSRSHSVFSITVESSTMELAVDESGGHIRVGKLHLVDLAGSERQSKTGSSGDQLKEATNINLSLSALGNVISALIDRQGKGGHIPYRDSNLTRLLQDSLGGNTKTLMIANIGPAGYNYEETLSTLRYANRAKNIKNQPRINEDPKDAMIRDFQNQIASLKNQLLAIDAAPAGEARLSGKDDNKIREETAGFVENEVLKLQNEKQATVASLTETTADFERNGNLLEKRRFEVEQAAEERLVLENQIQEVKRKLLNSEKHGGVVAVAATSEERLQVKLNKLSRKQARGAQKETKIAKLEESSQAAEEKCLSLQDEVAQQTAALQRAVEKYRQNIHTIDELQYSFSKEKSRLYEEIRILQRELELKDLIIEAFIPERQRIKVVTNQGRKEQSPDRSKLCRPRSALGNKRPISAFTRVSAMLGDDSNRFKYENLLSLKVEQPRD